MIPFCPDCKRWWTERDEKMTVSELLAASDWNGTYIHITGSQENDYTGVSSLFNVMMHRDLAVKFFGSSRVFSAEFHNAGEVNVANRNHLIAWAKENGLQQWEDVKSKYAEYKRLFPQNCIHGQSRLRISV